MIIERTGDQEELHLRILVLISNGEGVYIHHQTVPSLPSVTFKITVIDIIDLSSHTYN